MTLDMLSAFGADIQSRETVDYLHYRIAGLRRFGVGEWIVEGDGLRRPFPRRQAYCLIAS